MSTATRSFPQTTIERLLLLRTLVAFLGEKEEFGWWDSSFLGATGLKYLAIILPRSFAAGAIEAASNAARRLHDARIGKGRVCRLFRLPQAMEQKIHRFRMTADMKPLLEAIQSKDQALKALESLAEGSGASPDGPVKLGTTGSLSSGSIIGKLAAIYCAAFRSGKQAMPYFTTAN